MKKIIVIVATLLSVTAANAENGKNCENEGALAYFVALAKSQGKSIKEAMDSHKDNEVEKRIVIEAYKKPIYSEKSFSEMIQARGYERN